jgi:hypothetical protein
MTNTSALQNEAMFKPTTATEIRQLFGLHMYMEINKLPLMGLDRSTVITLKRLCQLRNNLHITNNLERPSECQDVIHVSNTSQTNQVHGH